MRVRDATDGWMDGWLSVHHREHRATLLEITLIAHMHDVVESNIYGLIHLRT